MIPINTSTTAIDEIFILRKAKRISSSVRKAYNTYEGRQERRADFKKFLIDNPFSTDVFFRFLYHIESLITEKEESEILKCGFF